MYGIYSLFPTHLRTRSWQSIWICRLAQWNEIFFAARQSHSGVSAEQSIDFEFRRKSPSADRMVTCCARLGDWPRIILLVGGRIIRNCSGGWNGSPNARFSGHTRRLQGAAIDSRVASVGGWKAAANVVDQFGKTHRDEFGPGRAGTLVSEKRKKKRVQSLLRVRKPTREENFVETPESRGEIPVVRR